MSITDIIERSEKLGEDILNRMMKEDCRNCGCERCQKILEALEEQL